MRLDDHGLGLAKRALQGASVPFGDEDAEIHRLHALMDSLSDAVSDLETITRSAQAAQRRSRFRLVD